MATTPDPAGRDRYCGAKKHQGEGTCRRPAGWGTDHVGTGRCKLHGGSTSHHRTAATRELARKAVETFGLPRDISPTEALLEEVRYTAGHVAWLRDKVRTLEESDLVWGVVEEVDKQSTEFPGTDITSKAVPNVWLELYYRERKHLVDVTKAAIAAGIEERRVRLAESQGAVLAEVIRRILGRLNLSGEQASLVPSVVPEELRRAAALN